MRLVRYLLYLYCVSDGFGNDFHSRGTAVINQATVWQQKRPLNFSGPCKRVRPAKLTNHSARTNSVRDIIREDIIAILINKKLMKKGSSCWGRKTAWRVQEVSVKEDNNRNVQRREKTANRENQDKNIRTVYYHFLSKLHWKFSF